MGFVYQQNIITNAVFVAIGFGIGLRNISTDQNNNAIGICEYEAYCLKCKKTLGYYTYGEWYPAL